MVADEMVAVASCPGLRRCHSSMRSFNKFPGISRGTKAPVGSTTLPSMLRLSFPARRYSSTSSQLRMKWSLPQKLHFISRGPESDMDAFARGQFWLLFKASMIDLVNSVKIEPSCSALMTPSRLEDAGEDTGAISAVECVPCKTNRAAA